MAVLRPSATLLHERAKCRPTSHLPAPSQEPRKYPAHSIDRYGQERRSSLFASLALLPPLAPDSPTLRPAAHTPGLRQPVPSSLVVPLLLKVYLAYRHS